MKNKMKTTQLLKIMRVTPALRTLTAAQYAGMATWVKQGEMVLHVKRVAFTPAAVLDGLQRTPEYGQMLSTEQQLAVETAVEGIFRYEPPAKLVNARYLDLSVITDRPTCIRVHRVSEVDVATAHLMSPVPATGEVLRVTVPKTGRSNVPAPNKKATDSDFRMWFFLVFGALMAYPVSNVLSSSAGIFDVVTVLLGCAVFIIALFIL
jgi:hypothetical protein